MPFGLNTWVTWIFFGGLWLMIGIWGARRGAKPFKWSETHVFHHIFITIILFGGPGSILIAMCYCAWAQFLKRWIWMEK